MDENGDEIAIVGIGCNFPGGEGIDNFWKVLVDGRNCTGEIPAERFDTKIWYDPNSNKSGKICTTRAALIDGFNMFDNKLFGIGDAEAERMDPQQKLLLECTYRALEDAGIPTESINGSNTGVFIGLMNTDYTAILHQAETAINHYDATGSAMSIAANRISYCFDLTGPSLVIDTACSSSLVALHYACQAIKQGDCDMALCGGVSCIIEPIKYIVLSKAKLISPDGTSKPFSRKADGYGRGEGCGVILLKSLRKAKEDFNKIWGVILISAINQDGRSVTPITKPSQKQQEYLLQSIYSSHIDPSAVQYVEAHGTGTPVRDPIEAASIGSIIGKNRSHPLKLGSVKGNIGHTESAAGIAGLIKILLMMHHEMIIPSLHYSQEISRIDPEKNNIAIPTASEKWEDPGELGRIAGVNSFGFGGTNVHVVIRQHKQKDSPCYSKRPIEIFILSAASSKSLTLTIEDTKQEISKMKSLSLQSLAYTSACRRSHINYKYRAAFVTTSLPHLQQQLALANTDISPAKVIPQIVFVFCGNGVNYKGMCKMLLRSEPVFRKKCNEIDEMLQAYTPLSVIDLLEKEFDDFSRPDIAQPLLFTIQVSLVALLRYWGVKPDSIVGHSVGEVAAAHCAGLLSLQDAVKVIYYRSTLQSKVTGGKMLVISNVPVTDISNVIESYSGRICIAAYNSPTSCTISGDAHSVEHLHEQLEQQFSNNNIFLHRLDVLAAYHSHLMDPILEEIIKSLPIIKGQKLNIELVSTVTGKTADEEDFTTGKYWARNIREPVVFEQALRTSAKEKKNTLFVEIGPRRALQKHITDILGPTPVVLPAVQPNQEYNSILAILETLFVQGYNLNWCNVFEDYKSIPTTIPRYQFDQRKYQIQFGKLHQEAQRVVPSNHPLIHNVSKDFTEFSCTISEAVTPYVYEHRNNGVFLVSGSFFVELGLAATINSLKPKVPLNSLEISIQFFSPCVVSQSPYDLKIKLRPENTVTHFEISESKTAYAGGKINVKRLNPEVEEERVISLPIIFRRCKSIFKIDDIYKQLSDFGFEYGLVYKQLTSVFYGADLKEVIANIKINKHILEQLHEYCIHPVVLDCFLQLTAIMATLTHKPKAGFPLRVGSLLVLQPLQEEMVVYLKTCKDTHNYIEVCGYFSDKNGSVLVQLKNVGIKLWRNDDSEVRDLLFENKWEKTSKIEMDISKRAPKALVFADSLGVAQQLLQHLHEDSAYIINRDWEKDMATQGTMLSVPDNISCNYEDVLFMWGIHKFSEDGLDNLTHSLAMFCEAYRQLILDVKAQKSKASIRTITYRTTEKTVDHINPGFALIGMTRSCAAEVTDIKFQLIDISSSNIEDIKALAQVIINYKPNDYPEVWINEGKIHTSQITQTKLEVADSKHQLMIPLQKSKWVTLYTADPYKVTDISAEIIDSRVSELRMHNVEVQIEEICTHTDDYFPVSVSSSQFGNTLYWNNLAMDKHKLIALDFTGTVTAVGKGVRKLKVGDHVAACYPTVASSRVALPETVCYKTRCVPCLRYAPCISPFVIAWDIFHHKLQKARHKPLLAIITSEAKSILCKVLTLTAKESGWQTTVLETTLDARVHHCNAMIIFPNLSSISKADLSHLPLLKDLVIVSNRKQPDDLQNQMNSCHDNILVHFLNLANIFQKAYLKQFTKTIYVWLKSMRADKVASLSKHIFTQTGSTNCSSALVSSYFTCQSVPVVVLDNIKVPSLSVSPKEQTLFRHDAVYIVTGGLTGLGFETVKFIAQHGGGHIVILSRRKPSTEMQQQMKMVENDNKRTRVVAVQCDVVVYCNVMEAINSIEKSFPKIPIKGVFHSAVILHDAFLEKLNMSLFEKVLSPKVAGTVNLHRATSQKELDFFVCYSSIASFLGNTGQANYAAANSFLDTFCHYRRNVGLAGQSINWGALNLGLLKNKETIQTFLEKKGIILLDSSEVHDYLKKSLMLNNPQQAVMKFD
ncbi:phthioceranic/hydroxyphthioceranic acid synthase-like [Ascaphus truei]|uniref:phthioceranic/hydroxyphthioceranic acid synthase-like n=1 Tax=Ascaphus truei TaxID=8439 RepID=UPI003F5A8722